MIPLLTQYSRTLTLTYAARDSNRPDEEDLLLSKLDRIWLAMNENEREQTDEVARQTRLQYRARQKVAAAWINSAHGTLLIAFSKHTNAGRIRTGLNVETWPTVHMAAA